MAILFSLELLAVANPVKDSVKDEKNTVNRAICSIEEDLYSLEDDVDALENVRYSFYEEGLINYFTYSGDTEESIIKPFDYYNIRPVKSGYSYSNKFMFNLSGRINYNLFADLKLEAYSFSGDTLSYWGSAPPYGGLSFQNKALPVVFAGLDLKSNDPDIRGSFGSFYPSSFSELFYSSPQNPSIYGPETLPAKGMRLGINVKPLSLEFITGIQNRDLFLWEWEDINKTPSPFFAGGKGKVLIKNISFGFSFLHSEIPGNMEDNWSLDTKFKIFKDIDFYGEFCRSTFYSDFRESANAFRLGLEKDWTEIYFRGEYIWISPSYDPLSMHRTFADRELLGAGRLANNRKGIDLCLIYPLGRGEVKGEFMYFSQIDGGKGTGKIFIAPLFPSLSEDTGNITAFQLSANYKLSSSVELKGEFEIVRLFRSSSLKEIDFTQNSFLFEADFTITDNLKLGGGIIYLKRKGFYTSSSHMSQLIPLLKGEAKINDNFSLSIIYRKLVTKNFLNRARDYELPQTTVRAVVKW